MYLHTKNLNHENEYMPGHGPCVEARGLIRQCPDRRDFFSHDPLDHLEGICHYSTRIGSRNGIFSFFEPEKLLDLMKSSLSDHLNPCVKTPGTNHFPDKNRSLNGSILSDISYIFPNRTDPPNR